MQFAFPHLFWLAGLAVAVAAVAVIALRRKRRALRRLSGNTTGGFLLAVRWPVQIGKTALVAGAALLLGLALLGPQWGRSDAPTQPALGRDVLVILDVSRSMLAEDVFPSRLERARAALKGLAADLADKGGYRIGLIVFADRALVLCPLTVDFRYFTEEVSRVSLDTLRLRDPVPAEAGTQIGGALHRAVQTLDKEMAAFTDVLLLSDGGDMDVDTLTAADALAQLGVPVHTVGLGDPQQGALIPVKGRDGLRTYLKHEGELVRTKLEEELLRQIAQRTKGRYVAVGTGSLALDRVFGEIVASQPTRELPTTGEGKLFLHRFQWFLIPALAFLLLEMVLGNGRKRVEPGTVAKTSYFRWVRRKQAPQPAGR